MSDAVLPFFKFRDETPDDLKENFKKDCVQRLMEKKIIYKREKNEKTNILDLHKLLVAFVQKV